VVGDLDAVVAAASARGATVTRAAQTQAQHGVRVAFIKDPDGHLVELVQMLQAGA